MPELYDCLFDFDDDLHRNIPRVAEGRNAFSRLTDDSNKAMRIKKWMHNRGFASSLSQAHPINGAFAWREAIEYVFNPAHVEPSRFSTGKFPVWYGGLEFETCVYETISHWRHSVLSAADFSLTEKPIRAYRRDYLVHCQAALIDFRAKTKHFPDLIGVEEKAYRFTRSIGERISQEGQPGLLSSSARHSLGASAAVFNSSVLSAPRIHRDLIYEIKPDSPNVYVRDAINEKNVLTVI